MTKITNQIILERIKHKHILFGGFSNNLTYLHKYRSWKKILDVAKSIGYELTENAKNGSFGFAAAVHITNCVIMSITPPKM